MGTSALKTPIVYPEGAERWILVITAISCAILELLDTTIVNVSLREISGNVGATTTEIAWVVTAYAISNVIIIPLTSMLSDLFGRRNYFTGSVVIFTVASLMCGLSTNLWTLVFWRFVQGLGGGGLLSTAQSIIIGAFPPEKISVANAIFGMGLILGPTFGPTLGGYITDNFSWHWIFFVNIPVGIVATILSYTYVTNRPGATKPKKIDWWGILFLVVSIGSIQYVLEEGTTDDWFESHEITAMTIIGLASLVAFIIREVSIDYPAVNIKLYKNYNMVMGSIMNFLLGLMLFGTVFIFPLFVQISLGWTATQTGMFMIPGALCTAIAMPLVARLLGSGINPKAVILMGIAMTFTFVMMLAFSSPDSSEKNFYLPFVLRGFGMAFMMSPILTLAVSGLNPKDMPQAIGLANMIRQLGGSVGIALINVYLSNTNALVRGNMIGYINQYSDAANERIQLFTQNFLSKGFSSTEAQEMANRTMDNLMTRQQMIVSYNHGFFMVASLILICVPVVFLIRYKKGSKAVVADH
ncbi:DHA2 family efflux MFS transporter permease subunit [Fluviicola sp.]|uniref:DHA2 family efflux MFS transporter permease subunit n=1 Tax=Fluviicola sp. TaxID=1917219 RepID=UPI00281923E9|nr:DHA2 family efflux MFS transporter permease subunit [Fluviicola sp.]MDR0802137.1 DHA2 family efflux MFS transporter permease subunit [Fluviicola sp.]